MFVVFASGLSAHAQLQIDHAYCGIDGSWREITPFLRHQLTGGTLSATLKQPFDRIGGDPAPSKGKAMLIDYRYNGKSWRLLIKEQYPVGFKINLPSSAAVAPGSDPLASAMMADIAAHPATPMWDLHERRLICLAYGLSLVAVICAGIAWFRCNGSKSPRS